ncbi:HET domain-containing protein [Colletotrichum filicis]|nr:HET domain-containing protein [Colletotrichum filicis]
MKLIHTQSYQLSEVADFNIPPFAVLSYAPAALFPCDSQQVLSQRTATHFNNTILQACQKADARGLQFLWFGSVCVDKTSSLGLQHAVSYSFRLLQAATVCFVYLQDLLPSSASLEESWGGCRYWKRSWTLQELIAPPNVEFFDANWNFLGAKSSPGLLDLLQTVTRIDKSTLTDNNAFSRVAIGVRLSWAAGREATRAEDAAYSLAGITGVNMSVRYGEGLDQAFARLVKKIISVNMDGSIFAWTSNDDQFARGLLPRSTSEFCHLLETSDFPLSQQSWAFEGNVVFNSNGLLLESHAVSEDLSLILEIGRTRKNRFGVRLQAWGNNFVRVSSQTLVLGFRKPRPCQILAARDIDTVMSQTISDSSKKRKRSGQLNTRPAEYSAILIGPPHTSSASSCVLHDDACSSCSYPEDTLDLGVISVDEEGEEEEEGEEGEEADIDDEDGESEEAIHDQIDTHERLSVHPNHPYQSERSGLLHHFSPRVRNWAHSATYIAPPRGRSFRKRVKIAHSESSHLGEDSDFEDADDHSIDGHYHFACPFYAMNPTEHQHCLLEDDLRSMEDVVEHIRKRHSKPPYCPKCRVIFKTSMARDEHIRRKICRLRPSTRIEGVDGNQLDKIKRVMMSRSSRSSEAEIWVRIGAVACPGTFFHISPYLQDGLGLEVSKVRDYWNAKGRVYTEEYMSAKGIMLTEDEDNVGVLEAFHSLTMADLVQEAVTLGVH